MYFISPMAPLKMRRKLRKLKNFMFDYSAFYGVDTRGENIYLKRMCGPSDVVIAYPLINARSLLIGSEYNVFSTLLPASIQ